MTKRMCVIANNSDRSLFVACDVACDLSVWAPDLAHSYSTLTVFSKNRWALSRNRRSLLLLYYFNLINRAFAREVTQNRSPGPHFKNQTFDVVDEK